MSYNLTEIKEAIAKYNTEYTNRFGGASPLQGLSVPNSGDIVHPSFYNTLIDKLSGINYAVPPKKPANNSDYMIKDEVAAINQYADDIKGLARCSGCSAECQGCTNLCSGCRGCNGCSSCGSGCSSCSSNCVGGCEGCNGCSGCSACSSTCKSSTR